MPPDDAADGRSATWSLPWYILWRLVGAVLIVFVVLTAVFVAVEVLPGDPTAILVPRYGIICGIPCASRGEFIAQWGLDKPLLDRYVIFVSNILSGNLGPSAGFPQRQPVWALTAPLLPGTLAMFGAAFVFAALIALVVGLPLSRRRGSVVDAVASFLFALPFAVPATILSLLALYVFAILYPVVPTSPPPGPVPLELYVLPMLVELGAVAALFTWMVRDDPLEPPARISAAPGDWRAPELRRADWIRRVAGKALGPVPALTPWIVTVVLATPVFWNLNSLGSLLYEAAIRLDGPTVMGIALVVGLLVILPIVVAADLLHEWITHAWTRADGRSADRFEVRLGDLRQGFRSLRESATAYAGIVLIVLLIGMAALAPWVAGPYPTPLTLGRPLLPPSPDHPLGTDDFGRDIVTLVWYGGGPMAGMALLAFAVELMAALGVTAARGFFGPRADVFLFIPMDAALVLATLATAYLLLNRTGVPSVVVPGLIAWPLTTRILMQETAGLVKRVPKPTPLGLRGRGRRAVNLVWGTGPLIVGNVLLAVSIAVSVGATLEFTGFGSGPFLPAESWAQILNDALNSGAFLTGRWWWFDPPALCIFATVLAPLLLAIGVKRIPLQGGRMSPPKEPLPSPMETEAPSTA